MEDENPKFTVDQNVGKLAKWLRMLGFDSIFFTGRNDSEMVSTALAENRIILTRDTQIAKRSVAINGLLKVISINSDMLPEQFRQVASELNMDSSRFRPFTLCLEDNGPLVERTKEEVKDRVPPFVFKTQEKYVECPKCRRIYWKGTHWQKMMEKIERLKY